MSGQIVPGSRNGLTTQGYPGLGPILNSDSNLLNRNSQGSLNQQSQINLNGTRPSMFSSNQPTQKRIIPSPTRGYSPTDNFRRDLLSNPPMLDLPERPEYSHWGESLKKDHRFLLDNSDFPALGQKGLRHGFNERTPSSPSALPPSRPGSISDGLRQTLNDNSHLSPSPLSSLTRPSMMGLDHPLSSTGSGQIPGLSIPNSRTNYLQTLSKTSNQDRNDDFVIQDQDFPALDNPTKSTIGQSSLDLDPSDRDLRNFNDFSDQSVFSTLEPNLRQHHLLQGVQNHPRRDEMGQIKYDPLSSKLNSIPASMLTDKYSFIGCLQVLEQIFENSKPNNTESTKQSSGSSAASSNGVTPPPGVNPPPGVGSSGGSANESPVGSPPGSQRSNRTQFPTLDKDMTKMGISFIKDNRLIYRFQSPFADMPCRVQDIDMFVPGEYLTNIHIREKLAEIKPSKYNEDLLFWMFYSNPNDHMQLTAADELIRRNWRFHKEKKIWISKTQNIKLREQNHHYEEGTFHVWDVESWKKVAKDMRVEYSKLEDVSPLHSSGRPL